MILFQPRGIGSVPLPLLPQPVILAPGLPAALVTVAPDRQAHVGLAAINNRRLAAGLPILRP